MVAAAPFDLVRAVAHPDTERARRAWQSLVALHGDDRAVVSAARSGHGARLVPFLGPRADELGIGAEARAPIDKMTSRVAAVNDRLCLEAGPLLAGLRSAGVRAVAFKGFGLLGDVHPDRRLRRIGDLDLLVRVEQLDDAIATLLRCGYRVPGATARALRWGVHAVNLGNPTGTSVDLHARPAHAFPYRRGAVPALWATAEPVPPTHPLASLGLYRPAAVEHALILAAHLARPAHDGIVHPWVDLHFLLSRHPAFASPDAGSMLIAAARRERVSIRVADVFTRLTEELGTPLPVDVEELVDVDDRARRQELRAIDVEARFARYDRGTNGGLRKLVDLSRIPTTGEPWRAKMVVACGELVATMAVHPDGMGARLRRPKISADA
jgi:hypothetical protein